MFRLNYTKRYNQLAIELLKKIQIDSEYYLTAEGLEFDSVLEWASSKFDYFIK